MNKPWGDLRRVGIILLRVIVAYVIAWPFALLLVLADDGALGSAGLSVGWFADQYRGSARFMWSLGGELATSTQLVAVVLAAVALVAVEWVRRRKLAQRSSEHRQGEAGSA